MWGEDKYPNPNDPNQGIRFVAPAGSVCLFVSTAWHSGGANYSNKPRMAVACVYGEPFIVGVSKRGTCPLRFPLTSLPETPQRPYENHFLVTDPTTLMKMPKKLQSLLGYSVGTPLVGRVNGSHPLKALQQNGDGTASIKYVNRKMEDSSRL